MGQKIVTTEHKIHAVFLQSVTSLIGIETILEKQAEILSKINSTSIAEEMKEIDKIKAQKRLDYIKEAEKSLNS